MGIMKLCFKILVAVSHAENQTAILNHTLSFKKHVLVKNQTSVAMQNVSLAKLNGEEGEHSTCLQ